MKWNSDEDLFLIEKYPIKGANYCAKKINRTVNAIHSRAIKLKLKYEPVKTDYFKNIVEPEAAYILGLIWADGSIAKNNVRIECIKEDIESLIPSFERSGVWSQYSRQRKNWREQISLVAGNSFFASYLISMDYNEKSFISPFKIINTIPENFQHLFYRGLIDGDGNFYFHKKQFLRQFTLVSTFEQDWSYMENLCKKLEIIKYKVKRIDNKKSKSSSFRITNKQDIIKLGSFIYQDFEENQIGLIRKKYIYDKITF